MVTLSRKETGKTEKQQTVVDAKTTDDEHLFEGINSSLNEYKHVFSLSRPHLQRTVALLGYWLQIIIDLNWLK